LNKINFCYDEIMHNSNQIYALHAIFIQAKQAVLKSELQESLNVSAEQLEKLIHEMRLHLDAPIKYDKALKSYYYDRAEHPDYELPGLWFNSSELYGLFASYQLLSEVGPGLLESSITPIKEKLESLLHADTLNKGELEKRIRILKMAARKPNAKHFSMVASALMLRKQLSIKYAGRDRKKVTERSISPQRLVHYRDNWYIDAWCHLRDELRTFSVDRIEYSHLLTDKAIDIDSPVLQEHFSTAYGIFSGKPNKKALLKFNQSVARWVAEEQWHPNQVGQFNVEGDYELEIPYRDERELVQDILRFAADVEVISPATLRETIKIKLQAALNQYD